MNKVQTLHTWVLGTKFTNKKNEKKYPGKTKVYIQGEDRIRMEVFDPFGFINVGYLIIDGDKMRVKGINGENYSGRVDDDQIHKLLKIKVDPKDLIAVFMQDGFNQNHWECSVNSQNITSECNSPYYQVNVKWSGLMSEKGTEVNLDHTRAHILFQVKTYKPLVEYDKDIFKI